jgi:hypothetical protein
LATGKFDGRSRPSSSLVRHLRFRAFGNREYRLWEESAFALTGYKSMRWSAWPRPNTPRSTSTTWQRRRKGPGNEIALDLRRLIQDFHRTEALIFCSQQVSARQGARRIAQDHRGTRRVVARGERVGSFRVVPAHETSSRKTAIRNALRDDRIAQRPNRKTDP